RCGGGVVGFDAANVVLTWRALAHRDMVVCGVAWYGDAGSASGAGPRWRALSTCRGAGGEPG
ncbi:MAG: hypothetical protein WB989_02645, partial [Mycobacterium sp.]